MFLFKIYQFIYFLVYKQMKRETYQIVKLSPFKIPSMKFDSFNFEAVILKLYLVILHDLAISFFLSFFFFFFFSFREVTFVILLTFLKFFSIKKYKTIKTYILIVLFKIGNQHSCRLISFGSSNFFFSNFWLQN